MILLNDFFFIHQLEQTETSVQAKIKLDKNHKIYSGHFPGTPVMPGVCMVQIVLETLGAAIEKSVKIIVADSLKFLSVIDPILYETVDVDIQFVSNFDKLNVTASLFAGDVIFLKLKATVMCS